MKTYITIVLLLLCLIPMAEAKHKKHHIFHITAIKMAPPPPAFIPLNRDGMNLSFKESCALIALEHTLEVNTDQDEAIKQAWAIAESMERERVK